MSYQPPPEDRENATARQPPGWYLDPAGRQAVRWWDGAQWGQQIQPLPGRGQEPQAVYSQQPYDEQPRQPSFTPHPQYGTPPGQLPYQDQSQYPGTLYGQPYPRVQPHGQQPRWPAGHHGRPPRQSWPRRHKVLTVFGGLLALIIIGGIASAAGGGNHASPSAPAVAGSSPTAAASTSTSATPAAASGASFSAKFDQAPLLMGPPDSHGVATYTVEFEVTNTSKVPGTPVCVLLNSVQPTEVFSATFS